MWVCTCASDYRCQKPGVGSPWPAVTDGCESPDVGASTLNKAKLPLYPYYQNVLVILHKPILIVTRMWATIILWSANSVALRLA